MTKAKKINGKNFIFSQALVPYGNLGDLIILKMLLVNLREHGRLIVNDRGVPNWYCQQIGLTEQERATSYSVNYSILVFLFRFRYKANIYLVARPGQNFGYGSFSINSLFKRIISVSYFALLSILGIRTCKLGTSIDSLSTVMKIEEKIKSKLMYFYSVRDSQSKNYVNSVGISKVEMFPDLAWLIRPQKSPKDVAQLMVIPNGMNKSIKINGNHIIFSFRTSPHSSISTTEYNNKLFTVLDKIVKLFCEEQSYKLVICYQVDQDYELSKLLKMRYEKLCELIFIERQIDTRLMSSLYSEASMVFSNRLHVLLFSAILGSLPVAVVDVDKHEKIVGIFSDAKIERLLLDINDREQNICRLLDIIKEVNLLKEQINSWHDREQKYAHNVLKQIMT